MEKEIIERWENGKGNLREWFESQDLSDYCDYEKIVHALIRHCLNYGYDTDNYGCISEQFEVSDYGCYQGTQIFLLHKECYQPNAGDYYVFDNDYGSCSACDTLQDILYGSNDKGDGLMTLCLHMVQRMKCLANLWED